MGMFIELKCQLKRYSVVFFIALMFLFMVFMVESYERQVPIDQANSRMMHQILKEAIQMRVRQIDMPEITGDITVINTYEEAIFYQTKLSNEVLEIDQVEAYQAYNLNRARYYLSFWFSATMLNDAWHLTPESERFLDPVNYFGSEWESVRQRLGFPVINKFSYPNIDSHDGSYETMAYESLYFLELYEKEILGATKHSVTPYVFIYLLFESKFLMILGAFSVLIGASIISQQRVTGVIKNKIFSRRYLFIIRSNLTGYLTALTISLIIISSIFVFLGFQHGFYDAYQPVLVKKEFVTEWKPDLEVVSLGSQRENQHTIGIANHIIGRSYENTFEKNAFMPLWQVVLIQLSLLSLYLFFWSSVGVLISVIVKNGILAMGLSGLIFFGGVLIKLAYPEMAGTMWDLVGFFEINQVMGGYKSVTLLQIVFVNGIGILHMHILAVARFRNQDVA